MGATQSIHQRFRALLISPTYEGRGCKLEATVEDGREWYQILQQGGVPAECITWISDSRRYPQIKNGAALRDIERELRALSDWASTKDKPVIFIAYSGHGTRQADDDGDEADGMDEGWVAADMGFVRDDYLNRVFLASLPACAHVVAVNDACHNGTIWDSKFTMMYDGKVKSRGNWTGGEPEPFHVVVPHETRALPVRGARQTAAAAAEGAKRSTADAVAAAATKAVVQRAAATRLPPLNLALAVVLLLMYLLKRSPTALGMLFLSFFVRQRRAPAAVPVAAIAASINPIAEAVDAARAAHAEHAEQEEETRPLHHPAHVVDEEPNDQTVARYSGGVANHLSAPKKCRDSVKCRFTAFSSSSDAQVSLEGAKLGCFTSEITRLVKQELLPGMRQNTLEQVLAWPRTGYSIVEHIGGRLNSWGVRQNPVWQVICPALDIDDTTRALLPQ